MNEFKDKTIYYVYEFLEIKDREYKELAKESLKKLAEKYNIQLKIQRGLKIDLKIAFKNFILNKGGALIVIPQLYNSL